VFVVDALLQNTFTVAADAVVLQRTMLDTTADVVLGTE
jgi:hypothetical protein